MDRRSTNARKYATAFGEALARQFKQKKISQRDLASAAGVSPSYVNHIMAGRKSVSPQWADLVADTLKLGESARIELHRAAARDAGYKLDLTKKT
jgi:transcriptional regulator with XRE-family HTH domain